ncbi:MAG: hypothetical protein J6S19_05320, partial [Lentisphaeria bacterium]|nr:hypothetical protein [Lentisphaeria bacterium]
QLKKPFEIIFDSKHRQWMLTDEEHNADSEFTLIVEEYKKLKFDRDAICQMVGMKYSSYHDHYKPQKKQK